MKSTIHYSAAAAGALALGAFAAGVLAISAVAIGTLAKRKAVIKELNVGKLC